MKTRTSKAAAACALAAVVGIAAPADAIVGGTPADQLYPVGTLQYDNGNDPNWPTCGVWLHDAVHLATNAHCVTNMPTSARANVPVDHSDPSIYHIRLGSLDRTSGGQVYHVRKIAVPDWWAWGAPDAHGRIGDVALLTLDRPVRGVTPALVRPLDLARSVREVGWGTTTDDAAQPAQVLQQIDVLALAPSACNGGPAPTGIDEVCLDHVRGGGGACHGDSGTAAFQRISGRRWAAIGSSGRTGTDRSVPCSQSPAIYTNVAYYDEWLRQASLDK